MTPLEPTSPTSGADPAPLDADADEVLVRRLRRLLALAVGSAVLALGSAFATFWAANDPVCLAPPDGGARDTLAAVFAWTTGALSVTALAVCAAGAVRAGRRSIHRRTARRWIATFVVGFVVILLALMTVCFVLAAVFVVGSAGCGL